MRLLARANEAACVALWLLMLGSAAAAKDNMPAGGGGQSGPPANVGEGVPAPEAVPVAPVETDAHLFHFNVIGGDTLSAGIHGVSGSLSSTEVGVSAGVFVPLSRKVILGFGAGDGESYYHFSGPSGLVARGSGESPWSHVRTLTANSRIMYRYDEHWTFLAGVNGSSAGADGARFGDTLTVGGSAGAIYRFSEDLTLGLGVTGQSRLGSSPTILPIPFVSWALPLDPQKRWRLEAGPAWTGPSREAGAALVFLPSKALSFSAGVALTGLGGGFRLDRDGPIAGGIGRVTSLPIVLGVDWRPRPGVRVSGFAGVSTSGTIESLDRNGTRIDKRDVGAAGTFGISASLSF
jgi:hypothetical protein